MLSSLANLGTISPTMQMWRFLQQQSTEITQEQAIKWASDEPKGAHPVNRLSFTVPNAAHTAFDTLFDIAAPKHGCCSFDQLQASRHYAGRLVANLPAQASKTHGSRCEHACRMYVHMCVCMLGMARLCACSNAGTSFVLLLQTLSTTHIGPSGHGWLVTTHAS